MMADLADARCAGYVSQSTVDSPSDLYKWNVVPASNTERNEGGIEKVARGFGINHPDVCSLPCCQFRSGVNATVPEIHA